MKIFLKWCPFCGGNDLAIRGDSDGSYVVCRDCGVETAMVDSYAEIISLWNTRSKYGEMAELEIKEEE